ncbi:unnamed protein product [Schistosoma margrebowiei]|uniref:Uncharacterized protein n=1 Tax=Schistosoma margrebowiei TaxID=48269 RepID=A0A183N3G7_9TREM|nr:unnamed protein product [Schistosoma margrebowiei]
MFFDCRKAALALPIHVFTSASEPPCSSMMLPRCRGLYNPVNHQKKEEVVVERHRHSQIPDIDKHKFLVPDDVTVAQFMWIIRKRIDISSEKALFLFVEKNMPQTSATIGQLYHNFHDDDGFLYISYSGENSFGSGS